MFEDLRQIRHYSQDINSDIYRGLEKRVPPAQKRAASSEPEHC
jgi:hypothetical protein